MPRSPTLDGWRALAAVVAPFFAGSAIFASNALASTERGAELTASERAELLATIDDHFGVDGVGPTDGFGGDDNARTCLTGVVESLRLHWTEFTEVERAELTARLAPWKTDLFAPRQAAPAVGDLPAPPVTCFGHYLDNWVDGDRFSVQYETGAITESEATDFLSWLDFSYDRQVTELGWLEPDGMASYPMLVMVVSGGSASAYTTVENCPGEGYIPYVVVYEGSFDAGDWAMTMATHEFNHASQYAYGDAHEFWFWEATATWIEEYAYPEMNDWAQNTYFYGRYPYIGMNAWAGSSSSSALFNHTYAMAVWNFYLDEHVGGHDLVQDIWNNSRHEAGSYAYWMPDAIDDIRGEQFDELYPEFLGVMAVRAFEERSWFSNAERVASVSSLPDSGESRSGTAPQSLGANFITVDRDLGSDGQHLHVRFAGDDSPDEWTAVLVAGNATRADMVELDVDRDGFGESSIPFGGTFDIHFVVSPIENRAQGPYYEWSSADQYAYTWEMVIANTDNPDEAWASSGGDGGGDDGGGDDGGGSDDGGSDDGGGADTAEPVEGSSSDGDKGGCSVSGGGALTAGWMLVLLGLARRRD